MQPPLVAVSQAREGGNGQRKKLGFAVAGLPLWRYGGRGQHVHGQKLRSVMALTNQMVPSS